MHNFSSDILRNAMSKRKAEDDSDSEDESLPKKKARTEEEFPSLWSEKESKELIDFTQPRKLLFPDLTITASDGELKYHRALIMSSDFKILKVGISDATREAATEITIDTNVATANTSSMAKISALP